MKDWTILIKACCYASCSPPHIDRLTFFLAWPSADVPRNVAGSPARENQQDAAEENKGSEKPSDLRTADVGHG